MNDKLLADADAAIKSMRIDASIDTIYLGPKEEQLAKSLQSAVNCYHRRNGDNLSLNELIKRLSQAELYLNEKKKTQSKKDEKVVCTQDASK